MKNLKILFVLLSAVFLCGTLVHAQDNSRPYPANADDVIAAVEVFSQIDFSVKDAVKLLGTINEDEYTADDWAFELIPFPSERERVKSVRLDTYDEQQKLETVEIDYSKFVSISYGKLLLKYGKPSLVRPPKAMCQSETANCPPAFVGYEFKFTPSAKKSNSAKRVEMLIALEMEWSKVIPKHTDKSLLAVKTIRFKRIVE